MKHAERWMATIAFVVLAFMLGRLAGGGPTVHAQGGGSPQVEVRDLGPSSTLVVYYPSQNTVYIYTQPFVGLPDSNCAYKFRLSTPGGKITREQCN